MDFLLTNKVTHIINCAGTELDNLWEKMGISYLTFNWLENDHQVILKLKLDLISLIARLGCFFF